MPERSPSYLNPLLQEFWPKLKNWYEAKFPNRQLFLTCTYRSSEEQAALFARNAPGLILTRCDGIKTLSKHNHSPSQAFDVAVKVVGGLEGPKVQWAESFYLPLSSAISDLGYEGKIRWGGWWTFHDYPHFETI